MLIIDDVLVFYNFDHLIIMTLKIHDFKNKIFILKIIQFNIVNVTHYSNFTMFYFYLK